MSETSTQRKNLVVGGLGFLGSHIARALHQDNKSVSVFDRPESSTSRLNEFPIPVYRGDFSSPLSAEPTGAFDGLESVLHYAWTNLPAEAGENITADAISNVAGSLKLFDAARAGTNGPGAHTIVFAGSGGTVYGREAPIPTPETTQSKPLCAYGVTKLAVEHYLRLHTLGKGIVAPLPKEDSEGNKEKDRNGPPPLKRGIVLRYGNPYGRSLSHEKGSQGFIDVALAKVMKNEPIEVWGDGSVVRDFFHINDLVRITLEILDRAPNGYSVYNVGSGEGTSVTEIIELIEKVTGKKALIINKPPRPIDVPISILDVSKLESELNLKTSISLEDGIAKTWEQLK